MKKLLILCSLLIFLFACKQEKPTFTTALYFFTPYANYPEFHDGQLKSIEEITYWATEKDGEYIKGEIITRKERDSLKLTSDFKVFFNEDGLHERSDYYSYDREVNSWISDIEDGVMKKSTWITKDTSRAYFLYEYDEKDHIKKSTRYRFGVDTLLNYFVIETNEDGMFTSSKVYNHNGDPLNSYKYIFNEKNLVESIKAYNNKDSLLNQSKCIYNEKGFFTNFEARDGKGEVTFTTNLKYTTYDENDNWLSALVYLKGEVMGITERSYVYY